MLHYDKMHTVRLTKHRLFITYSPYAESEVNIDFDVLSCHGRLCITSKTNTRLEIVC